jgi:pyruvate/2-oxoglutarate dehydrogenase complex dihydrolipoamide dehydrogenase (E3) component
MVAAMKVRAASWSVAVIDFRPFGGTCALRGCDPKKMAIDHMRRIGTLDWMFHEYRRTWSQKTAKRLQALSPGQCRVHETGIKMICEY